MRPLCVAVLHKIKNRLTIWPRNPLLWASTTKTWKHLFAKTYAPLCLLQHYSQWPRHWSSLSVLDRWLDKPYVVHTYNGILLKHKKGWNAAICNNVDGPWEIMLSEINQTKLRTIWFYLYVGYKTDSKKWGSNKTNKWELIDTDHSVVLTRGKGVKVVEGRGSKMYSEERWFNVGWRAQKALYISCIIETCTWNLYNLINQYHTNNIN